MSMSFGIGLGITQQRGEAFSPLALFASGEDGTWYDPSDLTTLFQDSAGTTPVTSDGDPVGRIDDKSGNGNHALQATAAKRPTYKTSAGLHWLEFDGIDDSMATGSIDFTATDKMSVFTGISVTTNIGVGILCELSTGYTSNDGTFFVAAPNNGSSLFTTSRGDAAAVAGHGAASGALTVPASYVFSGLHDISGDNTTIRVDGVQKAEGTDDKGAGNFGNYPLYIGMRAGASLPFTGKDYGLIIRGAQSSIAEIAQTEVYLADKSGVTL